MAIQKTEETMPSGVFNRLFIGFPVSSTIKMHLSQSIKWKDECINAKGERFQIVNYRERTYIGRYFAHNKILLSELPIHSLEVMETLKQYIPPTECDTLQVQIFSQLFIS